jgi:broad specificity phosphatase PhoE
MPPSTFMARNLRDALAVLLLVRHGETDANRRGLLLGRADPPLTTQGEEQAAGLASWVPRPDVLITSPLARARQTADAFGVDARVDDRWIELDYGAFDGLSPGAVAGDVWERWRTDEGFVPPAGESLTALGGRVAEACTELSDLARTAVVVVVTHVSPIKAALAWALDVPVLVAWRLFVEDASVSRVDIEAHGPVVRWFNRAGR